MDYCRLTSKRSVYYYSEDGGVYIATFGTLRRSPVAHMLIDWKELPQDAKEFFEKGGMGSN